MALILLTNAIALLGVAYNQSGSPDSILQLSQRELQVPYGWRASNDNSGISLRLQWRFPGSLNTSYHSYNNNDAGWLGKAKLASLGFDVGMPIDTERSRTTYEKQLSKPVFLVLEFDGAAYRQSIELAKKDDADDSKKKERDRNMTTALEQELNWNSRLFVVDAGLDREALRARYPDTHHYSIVHGQIKPTVIYSREKQPLMTGYIKSLGAQDINVPFQFRDIFETIEKRNQRLGYVPDDKRQPFEATVAFGKRLEPWIEAASTK